MSHSHAPYIYPKPNPFCKPYYDKYLLVLLIMLNVFVSLIYFPAPFALIVILSMRLLNIFFGNVHIGPLYVKNTPN